MKRLGFLLLMFPFLCYSQEWKKIYVSPNNDTVKPGTVIKINEGANFTYIFPNYYDGSDGPMTAPKIEKRKRYLLVNMPGKTYEITRLSRIKVSKNGYKAIAAFEVRDKQLQLLGGVEYIIELEQALNNSEFTIIPN